MILNYNNLNFFNLILIVIFLILQANELKLYYRFFTEALGVSAPLVQIPGPEDVSVFFQLKSVEDRQKVFAQMKGKVYLWKEYKLGVKVRIFLIQNKRLNYEQYICVVCRYTHMNWY